MRFSFRFSLAINAPNVAAGANLADCASRLDDCRCIGSKAAKRERMLDGSNVAAGANLADCALAQIRLAVFVT